MKRGEIYWIEPNFKRPTKGSVQRPNRPAIIVSNDKNNQFSNTVEVVYLTATKKKPLPTHATIRSAFHHSTALCEQVQTVSVEQVGRYVGTCTAAEMIDVDRCIAISLGLEWGEQEKEHSSDEDKATEGSKDVFEDSALTISLDMIDDLRIRLAKAERGEEIFRSLYNELLDGIVSNE